MKKIKIGNLAKIFNGYAFKSSNYSRDGFQIIRITNVKNGYISNENKKFIKLTFNALERFVLKEGDILISLTGNVGRVGRIRKENLPAVLNQRVGKIIIKSKEVLPNYLFHILNSSAVESALIKKAKGIAQKNIASLDVENIEIPLPSLEDQKHIVKILDKADTLRQKRKQAMELLDDYVKSVFLEMFGDPVTNPKGWKTFQLKLLIQGIAAGWSANGEVRQKSKNEYGVLKISSVTYGCFNPHEYKAVKITETNNKKLVHPKKGAILFSRANTRELVGASCIVTENYPDLFLPDKLWEITVDVSKVNPVFFQKNISHISWRNELAKKATGTSGSMLNISMERLRNAQIAVPPIEMQIKFAKISRETESLKQKMLLQSVELETQFQALIQKAFKGEL